MGRPCCGSSAKHQRGDKGSARPRLNPRHQDPEYNETLTTLYETVLDTLPPTKNKKLLLTSCWKRQQDPWYMSPSATDGRGTAKHVDRKYKNENKNCMDNHQPHCCIVDRRRVQHHDDDDQDDNVSLLDPEKTAPLKYINEPSLLKGAKKKIFKRSNKKSLPAVRELNRLNCLQMCEDRSGAFPNFEELKN